MSNPYSREASASTSHIPTFSGSAQSFAARAMAKKAALEAQSRLAPPPGFASPAAASSVVPTRGRSRVPSPSFYGRERRHGGGTVLLPVAPSLAPSTAAASSSTPSPIPRTPTPPPVAESPSAYIPTALKSSASKTTVTEAANHPLPPSKPPSSANSSSATEKRTKHVIRKKVSVQAPDSKIAMRTGSTTSTNASSASFTTSTSASHPDRGYGQNTSVFGVSMPPTSYTYGARSVSGLGGRHAPRTMAPPPGLTGAPAPSAMQRARSGSGSQSSSTSTRLSVSGISSQITASKAGAIPPPLTIPAAAAENYNSSPSTANCGSPGMFSYNSTPTSSSTNPSLFQSPGFSPPVQRVRTSSPTRPLMSKYAGVTAATDKLGMALATKETDGTGNTREQPKQIKPPSRSSLIPTNFSTASLLVQKTRSTSESITKTVPAAKHSRKASKESVPSKSTLSVGFAGFHFRRPSKELASASSSQSQIGRSGHSRQSSCDSSNVRSPGEQSTASAGYFSTSTSPVPIPPPSSSSSSLRLPPSRPSRDGASDDLGGFTAEVPVIQSGIVATRDNKTKGPKMKIITSSSLPHRSGATFGNANGSSSSINLMSTSVPGQQKAARVPTPTSARGATVVHGFASASPSPAGSYAARDADSSPRKLKKDDRKGSTDKSASTTAPPPSRPSLFSRARTKSIPAPATEKEKSATQKRAPGPAAGTGHEGYHQFIKPTRTRSSSGSSIPTAPIKVQSSVSTPPGSWGRVAGANAMKSPEMDDFFASRLEPVVMKGGVLKQSGSVDMSRTGSSQSATSSLPKLSIKGGSQASSIELPRTDSSQAANSRDPSLDIQGKIVNEFDQFDFGPKVTSQRRPSITVDTSRSKLNGEPSTPIVSPPSSRPLQGKSIKSALSIKSEEKESKLKAPSAKKLIPPPVGPVPQPTRRWNIFSRSQSAPDVSKDSSKSKTVPPKTAPQSPVIAQEVRFGNENEGGYIRDVHSPPIKKSTSQVPRAAPKQQRPESVLLPEPPVLPRLMSSRTPSPVTAVNLNAPMLPRAHVPSSPSNLSPRGLMRPPPGLPIPAELKPTISVTNSTPGQPPKSSKLSELQNASPVSALTTSPSSVLTKSASPVRSSGRPSPANLPVRNIQELMEKAQQDSASPAASGNNDYADEENSIGGTPRAPVDTTGSTSDIATPIMSPPITPEPNTNPSPGRRQRLGNFAIGRIPKAANVEASTIKIPTLAEILPPPPSLRDHQQQQPPLKIHPPHRIAHPPVENAYSSSSEGEDDGSEGIDYINTRNISLARLAPLVTSGWSQTLPPALQRVSGNPDDWDEYDDYLDEMSAATPQRKTPSLGAPFPDITKFKPDVQDEIEPARRLKDSPTLPSAATFGVIPKFAPSNKKKLVLDQGKLVQGRPIAARPFFSPTLPTARSSLFANSLKELNSQRSSSTYSARSSGNQKTIAFADFIAAYAEVDRGVMSVIDPLDKSHHSSSSQAKKVGVLSPMSSITDFEDDSSTDSDSYRDSIISAMPGTEDALEGEMKVRLWALMTSRWLSFGRVLVSPAHEEIKASGPGASGNRILVIDGLGNDDWSFYCSLNYPNATVYNLTPSQASYPTSPAEQTGTGNSSSDNLNNHHQIHHASFASPFPFPSGFFTVVTFRFLPCASDALWPFIISQCMRVLKPGGHLELSVLDIDMVNMGPRTKRTVDEIKVNLRKHQSGNGSDWTKKTASEKALRLLAKRGFTDITRCRVGLPTVGNVDGSREEQASMQQILKEGNSPDEVDMGSAEGINRVVSKVGRWWYNKCFENIGEDGTGEQLQYQKTLWEDKTLLRECEKKKTNFRMLISFAKKPST